MLAASARYHRLHCREIVSLCRITTIPCCNCLAGASGLRGISFAPTVSVLRLEGLVQAAPHLPARGRLSAVEFALSGIFHVLMATALALTIGTGRGRLPIPKAAEEPAAPVKTTHFVFIARDPRPPGGGGGGGGNRQTGPIRRAEGIGHDAITLRIAR